MSLTPIIDVDAPTALAKSSEYLRNGGVIIVPTDTIYGIGCSAFLPESIDRIYAIKGRDFTKALPILVGSLEQINLIAKPLSIEAGKLVNAFWPGPLTIVVPKKQALPQNLSPYETVGIRMPNHSWLLDLLIIAGPMATTSANPSGKPEARNIEDALKSMDGKVDLIINGGQSASLQPSTVVDCSSREIKILREGPIISKSIEAALH